MKPKWMAIGIGGIAMVLIACSGGPSDEERRAGLHCLNAAGYNSALYHLVRAQLHDPDSFQEISTGITPVNDDGKHVVLMEFSASNVFGGRVRQMAGGLIDPETCDATLVGIE